MTRLPHYPVPWRAVFAIGPNIMSGEPASVDAFSRAFTDLQIPPPQVEGLAHLGNDCHFLLAANHYQRKGLWIAHPASTITQAIRERFSLADPVMRWIVTANWPPLRLGGLSFPSPGDILLPRVARALSCFAVPVEGSQPGATAASLRRLLRAVPELPYPIGLFPEGVRGSAGHIGRALPGIDRLLRHLCAKGLRIQPAGISETPNLTIRFGAAILPEQILASNAPDELVMSAIRILAASAHGVASE